MERTEAHGDAPDRARPCGVAPAERILEELSHIALADLDFSTCDAYGNERERPSLTARLKALELLGKYHTLFVDRGEPGGEEGVRIVLAEDVEELSL